MIALQLITLVFLAGYSDLMLKYRGGWKQQRLASDARWIIGRKRRNFSIVVPARNEADNIPPLLQSLFPQQYHKEGYELVVVDDHSTDDTAALVDSFPVPSPRLRVLRLAKYLHDGEHLNSAKKRALALGIQQARHPFIATTDADCVVPKTWLWQLSTVFRNTDAVLVAAPVAYARGTGLLYLFQSLDFMAMQGITAAAHALNLGTMSNGANLAFRKTAYEKVGGYTGIDHMASGDDYLLTRKMVLEFGRNRVRYLLHSDAVVTTSAQPTWSAFFQQRIRWASKSGKYNDRRLTAILMLVYATNLWLVVLALMSPFVAGAGRLLLLLLATKTCAEMFFLWPVAGFFNKRRELLIFPFLQPLHILYIVLAGFLGMRGGYKWKGRNVR